jgi:hypothetical protein
MMRDACSVFRVPRCALHFTHHVSRFTFYVSRLTQEKVSDDHDHSDKHGQGVMPDVAALQAAQ